MAEIDRDVAARTSGAAGMQHSRYRDSDLRDPDPAGAGRVPSRRPSGTIADDIAPVLGMMIGGALGYIVATALSSGDGARSSGSARFGIQRGRQGRGSGIERFSRDRADRSGAVETDETSDLIASDKVESTAVYDRSGERLGQVHNFMVGKRSGRVAYAVMSFGGFLGIGERYHPVPWKVLTYDPGRGGYVIDADKDLLTRAPSYERDAEPFARQDEMRRIRDYWASGRLAL